MEPEDITFELLQEITHGFSEERKLGEGAFGVVYKGVTKNGEDVAVKKLKDNLKLDDNQFRNEFNNLVLLKHQNIVQILGYCYETKQIPIEYNGRTVLADNTYRVLCLEYLHNGSLQKHLSDKFYGLVDWHTWYKIIKGTCEGLKYIHEELEKPLYHLDLKPDNILLDKDMVPKISDFGLSRIFAKELTRSTRSPLGTIGYQPPEYIDRGEISKKFDIFSLGVVMIKILSGPEGYSICEAIPNAQFIDLVQKSWRNRLQAKWSGSSLQTYCQQVERCTEVALSCIEPASSKRPSIVDIIDMLNETETETDKLPHKRCSNVISDITMANKEIRGQHQYSNLISTSMCNELEFIDTRETSSDAGEELIVGRTKEANRILSSLHEGMAPIISYQPLHGLVANTKSTFTILPIYGIGGIGKTTFAKLIYSKFKSYRRAWVYVSPSFDVIKIGNSIVSQLSKRESKINDKEEIRNYLTKLLPSKKILIVLDDLWEDNQFRLEDLKVMLNLGDGINTIVLVTTRSEIIAKKICTNYKPYKIEFLTNDMCWEIIKRRSGIEARYDKERLTRMGRDIALKCGGVALAAQSLGFMLQSMTTDQWFEVKYSDIWNEYVSEDASSTNHVLASLKLSYSNMTQCLRSCFTYCAMFPKGYRIVKDDLIHQWISLDFTRPTKLLSAMQLCEKYIMQLLGLSFLQHSPSPRTAQLHLKDIIMFTMHDLVHDLARSVMVDEIFDATKEGNARESSYRYVLLTDCNKPLQSFTTSPDKIRAMHFLGRHRIELSSDVFSYAKSLRVLDFRECSISNLPDFIGELKQLRYLNAQRISNRMISSRILELSELIYLNLSWSSISELPKSIGELKQLMHLDLSHCTEIKELPESFVNLKRLIHLDLSECSQLRCVCKALGGLPNIEYLNLSNQFGYSYGSLEAKIIGNLISLRYLGLSGAYSRASSDEVFNFIDCICTLSNLEHLDLSNNYSVYSLPQSIGRLRKLRTLDLSRCPLHGKLPECIVNTDDQGQVFCHVETLDGESSSNLGLLEHANPDELDVDCLEHLNLKSAEEVRSIELKAWTL